MATNTYVALDKVTLGTAASSITFSSIPATYTDLVLVLSAATTHTSSTFTNLQFNGDTSTNYSATEIYGTGSSAASNRDSNTSRGWMGLDVSISNTLGDSVTTAHIMNYANTTTYKTFLSRSNRASSSLDYPGTNATVAVWRNTAAITSVTIKNSRGGADYNFAAGTIASLYGIRAEGISPAAKATGGAIYSDSLYYYHVFAASGTFTPTQSLIADVLVVAGGGAGGGQNAGGGGAGGLLTFTSQSLTAQNYTCTVGAGGAGSYPSGATNGVNSSFTGLTTALGGGLGGCFTGGTTQLAGSGGSGGGAHGNASTVFSGGSGTSGQGFAGGNSISSSYAGGGGGGAGAVGSNVPSSEVGGNGGIGLSSSLINAIGAATGVGQLSSNNYYLAGGGGGAGNITQGVGGLGGGGTGSGVTLSVGQRGTVATGGGGGASRGANAGGNGGSGVIIVRYAK